MTVAIVHASAPTQPVRLLGSPLVGLRSVVLRRFREATGWGRYDRARLGFRTVPALSLADAPSALTAPAP